MNTFKLDLYEINNHIEKRFKEIKMLHDEYRTMVDVRDYDYYQIDSSCIIFVEDFTDAQMSNEYFSISNIYFEQENWKELYIDKILDPKRKEREAKNARDLELKEIREREEYKRLKNKFEKELK